MRIFYLITIILLMVSACDSFVYYSKRSNEHLCTVCFSQKYTEKPYTYALGIRIPLIPQKYIKKSHTYNDYEKHSWTRHNHKWVFIKASITGYVEGHSHGGIKPSRNFFAQQYEKSISFRNFIKQKIRNKKLSAKNVYQMLLVKASSLEKKDIKLQNAGYYLYCEFEKVILNNAND
ncbi:hypothetical protein [Candidatus Uabimicrobium amorphum]|uniref:Lipoprotein n=1 Tax=Uabimicrobium amorphum TaxID=2596890 RepID=A0A5S9IMT9_UABAM|nr:hypothetical protein [Candidatus Uabimicrobium amorphum]BBM84417.1 hypothetical protein UABAM_02777 [Candidatus Uabimicrobium amorphum]